MLARVALASVSALAVLALAGAPADAAVKVKLEPVVTGVNTPLAMVQPKGDDRKFVIEQWGRVRIIDAQGNLLAEPFLDIRNRIVDLWADFDEKGLLGIAFHPDFATNGKFYVAYSTRTNYEADLAKKFWWDRIPTSSRSTRSPQDDPNIADENSETIISSIDWPQFNHNGHWIGFGPDGKLYISTGDGGYANDWGIGHNVTEGNGQDLTTPARQDPAHQHRRHGAGGQPVRQQPRCRPAGSGPTGIATRGAAPSTWAARTSCSAATCSRTASRRSTSSPRARTAAGARWRPSHCFNYVEPNNHPASCDQAGLTLPIIEYKNCTAVPDGCIGISVTGGFVYRGAHKAWDGAYIFGDWSKSFAERDGQLFVATKGGDGKWTMDHMEVTNMEGKLPYVLAFAQDQAGEVYALTSVTTGPNGSLDTIYKIVPAE